VAVETNGTQPAPADLDWICVSPKADAPLVLTSGDELKLVSRSRWRCPSASRACLPPLLPAADGRPGPRAQHALATEYCLAIRIGASPADPQDHWHRLISLHQK
jgi:hypothetical protein